MKSNILTNKQRNCKPINKGEVFTIVLKKVMRILAMLAIVLALVLSILYYFVYKKSLTYTEELYINNIKITDTSISISGSLKDLNQNVINSYDYSVDNNVFYVRVFTSWITLRKVQTNKFDINLNGDYDQIDKVILIGADGKKTLYSK